MDAKELAKALGVSATAISKHYHKNAKVMGKHCYKEKTKRIFDPKAQEIMAKSFKSRIQRTYKSKGANIANYESRINDLKRETEAQQKNIVTLEKLLNQQQQLNLNTQKELRSTQRQLRLKYEKHSWLWRLFH